MRSPATKHARLIISVMSAMHRNASLCEVVWEEGEMPPEVACNCSKLLSPISSGDARVVCVFL